jgi:probable O-glycosylation ligase (exosortase A-associated)
MLPIRDIVLTVILVLLVPAILARPYLGPLAWAWVGMMVPHRLTWGFAYSLPFAQVVAVTTLIAFFIDKDRKPPPGGTVTWFLALLYLWMSVTAIFAVNPTDDVWNMWVKVSKIQLMLWVTMMMITGRRQIELLIWTIVISIGFYGVKGGIWTILHGGGERVWGPAGSFIEGNNELALALVIVMPLMWYLRSISRSKAARLTWMVAIGLCMMSVLGSHSRGALLAIVAMMLFLGLKSRRPLLFTVLNIAALGVLAVMMPDNWTQRMETITTHEDTSAQSRLYTWRMIWNLVIHRPQGAGFDFWTPEVWSQYAVTEWDKPYAPHSIYFQALGEHGFLGLALYVGLGIATWRLAGRMSRASGTAPETAWLRSLLRCVQVSLISFGVGGAFLNLVNFDVPYYLAAIVAMLWRDCRVEPASRRRGSAQTMDADFQRGRAPPVPPTPARQQRQGP